MYFLRRLRPLEIAGERVRSLRASLNAPVIRAPDLPAGPARAVIVVHREARGGMDATVGVRSVVSGEIAYWSFDGELASDTDLSVASDAALTFAESLGFLFDDGAGLAGAAAEKAFRSWRAPAEPATERGSDAIGEDDATDSLFGDDPLLELDELAHAPPPPSPAKPESPVTPIAAATSPAAPDARTYAAPKLAPAASATPKPEAPPSSSAETPPPAAPGSARATKTLSKFRARDAAPAAENAASTATATARKAPLRQPLARVALVKRRSPEDERKLVIRKLLTSF
jgi:hypothetical protein